MKRWMGRLGLAAACLLLSGWCVAAEKDAKKITFRRVQIDPVFRAEGVAVADFNGDGKPDIAAGSVYYTAPDWKMHPILDKPKGFDPKNYSDVFVCAAMDVNRDGRPDLITIDMPGKETWWYENPGPAGGAWKRHMAVKVTNGENPVFLSPPAARWKALVCGYASDGNPDGSERQMVLAFPGQDPDQPWTLRPFSTKNSPGTAKYYHGLGAGDINGDGLTDVVCREGWWEAPTARTLKEWTFHKANLCEDCAEMLVYDCNGDGMSDVISSSAHRYGIWWHEQTADGWKTHLIDKSVSQTHAMCLADINGDGLMDFVTGKRFWAHTSGDPGINEPAILMWFELSRKDGRPEWTKHVIDDDSGVGIQFVVTDVNGDGLWDVVTSNKKGVYYFEQRREVDSRR